MSKLYTTTFFGALVICFLLCPVILYSQNKPSLKEIKTTGKYYSGDAWDYDTIKAKEMARDELMAEISKKIQDSNSFNTKSEILVNYIQYLVKKLGDDGYIKVVAFVPIENVTRIIESKEPLVVTKIEYSEAKVTPAKEEGQNTPITITDEKTVANIKSTENKFNIETQVPKNLLVRLVACNTSIELGEILEKEKSNNALMYSISENFRKINSPDNFYIVFIDPDTKMIVSFFDKGSSERKDLKNGTKSTSIQNEPKSMTQIWIQLF